MNYKLFLLCVAVQSLKLVHSKSFTLVLDTTDSMQEEIDVLKRNLPPVLNILKSNNEFQDYIIVPFNDPDIGTPVISTNPDQILASLSTLTLSGGHDCPENSLSGIQRALEVSQPESLVYVFTDAFANDENKFRGIESLCKSTGSQVVIFLSGSCFGSGAGSRGSLDVYYEIAKSCSGALFRFDVITLRKAFKYMEEIVRNDWNDVISYEPFTGYKIFTFSADTFTRDILVAVSGDYPHLQISSMDGSSVAMEKVVDARQALIVRVSNFKPGVYQVGVRCRGLTSLIFYKRNRIPFEYGFSTKLPRNLKETSLRPIPGWSNYILIVLPPTYKIQLSSVELQMTDGDEKKTLPLTESEKRDGAYITSVFVQPDRSFRCVIHGRDSTTYEEITGFSKIVDVQRPVQNAVWTTPVAQIIQAQDNALAEFGNNYTLACKVKAYPKPEIHWEDELQLSSGMVLTTEEILLEMPSTYLNFVTMNATSNSTICCKAKNALGEDIQCLPYYVNRTFTFEVVESPKDETFEFGTEGKLICKVDAYPDPEYKWYHNDTAVQSSDNLDIIDDEYALVIKNMSLDEVGYYKCEVTNPLKTESFLAEVTISGLEAPRVEIEHSDVILNPGDYRSIECRVVKGNPTPGLKWKFQSLNDNEFLDEVPSDVYVDDGMLKISAAKIEHNGNYRCIASNLMGEDYGDVSIKIQYAPKITNAGDDATVIVMEGDVVELACDVDAVPVATIRWEVTQDDVIVALDERHTTDDRNTHRFYALWKDSGNYHCIAENDIGRSEKTVTVNVQVAPFIQPPEARLIEVTHGSSISLPCNVLYGNPVPTTRWEFIGHNSTTSVLSRGKTTRAQLNLNNISRANEGMYLCIADNEVGNDRIRIYLKMK